MRISDWSSDVCSSDLPCDDPPRCARPACGLRAGLGPADRDADRRRLCCHAGNLGGDFGRVWYRLSLCRRPEARCLSHAGCDLPGRSEEHTSELQSLMRISYAVFCLKKKKNTQYINQTLHMYSHDYYKVIRKTYSQ